MKLNVWEKIMASVGGLLSIGLGIYLFAEVRVLFLDPTGWLFLVVGLLVTIIMLALVGLGIATIAYVWIVPSPSKKDKQLEEWLKTEGYTLCDQPVRVVYRTAIGYLLNPNGYLDKQNEASLGFDIWIGTGDNKELLTITSQTTTPLFDDFAYHLEQKYLILFFDKIQNRMLIYTKKDS